MILGRLNQTVGDRRRYVIDYSQWLDSGVTCASAVFTVTGSTSATVDTNTIVADKVIFFLNNGLLNEVFTVNVAMTDSRGEIKHDTLQFTVVAP